MVRTRSQLENVSKDEFTDEVLSLENFKNCINVKFSELNDCSNDFGAKCEMVNSNLSITRCCTVLLLERIIQLEHNNLNNAQYIRRETLEINECHLILLMTSWNNLCAKRYLLQEYQLAYKCRQLKSVCKIHLTWFCNSTLHIKLVENGTIHKIFHPTDIEKVLGVIILMNI